VKQPITIYEIGGIGGGYNLFLSREEEVFFPLPEKYVCNFTTRFWMERISEILYLKDI
jgi:hypothetical protein